MPARATVLIELCNTITRQPIALGSCSNTLMDSASLLAQTENLFFVLHVGFSLGDVIMGTCFDPCGRVYLALDANPTVHFLAQIFFGI